MGQMTWQMVQEPVFAKDSPAGSLETRDFRQQHPSVGRGLIQPTE